MVASGPPGVVDAFGAIAHPLRRQILTELAGGELSVHEIANRLPISRPAVSQHLRLLQKVGVVTCERQGRESRYRLRVEGLSQVSIWLSAIEVSWSAALVRLAQHLEDNP